MGLLDFFGGFTKGGQTAKSGGTIVNVQRDDTGKITGTETITHKGVKNDDFTGMTDKEIDLAIAKLRHEEQQIENAIESLK